MESTVAVAEVLASALGLYLALGLAVAVPFVAVGARRVDPNAVDGTWGFRLVILPGAVLLWPVVLRRWLASTGAPPIERNAHRNAHRDAQRDDRHREPRHDDAAGAGR